MYDYIIFHLLMWGTVIQCCMVHAVIPGAYVPLKEVPLTAHKLLVMQTCITEIEVN